MAHVTFRFLEPVDWIGKLVTWRLHEPWSHVVILIDDTVYSSEIPFVAMLPADHTSVDVAIRKAFDITLSCTDYEVQTIKKWCEAQVGLLYDLSSILGWIFGFGWLQSRKRSYCFEFCHKALVEIGLATPLSGLIRGSKLLAVIREAIDGRVVA